MDAGFFASQYQLTNQMQTQDSITAFDPEMPYERAPKRFRAASSARRRRYVRRGYGTSRFYTRSSVRGVRIPRGPAGQSFMSSSTEVLNAAPTGGTRVKGMLLDSYVFGTGAGIGGNFVFDPSGTYGIHAGATIPGWANMVALFDEYKVNKITATFRYTPTDQSEDINTTQVFFCQNRDAAVVGTRTDLTRATNVFHHIFTPENPMCKLEITPWVFDAVYNSGALAAYGRTPHKMGWQDCEVPAQVYGMLASADVPTGTLVNATLKISYEYDVSFRYRS